MDYIIGCSGFHYKHWKGDFYPADLPLKKWFEYYCQHFNSLELNVTFYRFPTLSMLETWYTKAPDHFIFTAKAPRSITHFKKMHDTRKMTGDFYELLRNGLKEKLGCVLFQFPPNFAYSPEHLKRIIQNLDPDFENVVEFRHKTWWAPEIIAQLGGRNISFCGMSHPGFPDEIIKNTPFLYYRMHGESQLYASNYSKKDLDTLYENIRSMDDLQQAYIYFNNDIQGYATKNAAYLIEKAAK